MSTLGEGGADDAPYVGGGELGASWIPGGQNRLHTTKSSAGPLLELRADGE